ncbi:MAG: hypothetical protein HY695_34620 [Deltaproteobacteria bacterium]|nr:hypothetical protein [Deltaproteobacteria bacterium]
MYGWRGRIGHIYPAVVAETFFSDFFRVIPEGITLALTNLSIQTIQEEDLKRAESQLDQAVDYLAKRKVDCIIIGGAPMFRLRGLEGEKALIERVRQSTGIPTTTSQTAAVEALRYLGIKRLAVATPYHDDQNEMIAKYLRATGFDLGQVRGLKRHIAEIHEIPLDSVYRHVKRTFLDSPEARGVYVPCGHFTVPRISELEADIKVPVVTATYAMVWAALRMIKVKAQIRGHGCLLETVADQ